MVCIILITISFEDNKMEHFQGKESFYNYILNPRKEIVDIASWMDF